MVGPALGIEGGSRSARDTACEKGEKRYCALSWSRLLDGPRTLEEADEALDVTSEYWRKWLADGTSPTIAGAGTCSAAR